MSYEPISHVKVLLCFKDITLNVGQLAKRGHKIYFEFDTDFIQNGIEISPIECPLKSGVQNFDPYLFGGLPGVFYDSLPDGWGRILVDRRLRELGVMPQETSVLDRLAFVGSTGMGALIYHPEVEAEIDNKGLKLDELADSVHKTLVGVSTEVIAELLALNGSSAGARPKALIGLHKNRVNIVHGVGKFQKNFEPWIIKFPNLNDGEDAGAIEFIYALMAKDAGLNMTDVHLFPSKTGSGYFSVKRFDRQDGERIHMHSVCGLLHTDFRAPSLDYEDLLSLTMMLTRDMREVEKMYQLAVFNVLSHNRDDHAKNFSFLLSKNGEWKLSPCYDLTFSYGPNGEQSTMVVGEGREPGCNELIKLGLGARISRRVINSTIERTREALSKWPEHAKNYGVLNSNKNLISLKFNIKD